MPIPSRCRVSRAIRVRRAAEDLERGSVSILVACLALALLLVVGLAYDGGEKFRMADDANEYAQQAALTGAQAINQSAYLSSGTIEIDPAQAVAAADAYLNNSAVKAAGVSGHAQVIGAHTIEVTVTMSEPTAILGLMGIGSQSVTATATADLLHGVNAPE
jgi:hypothetical protein